MDKREGGIGYSCKCSSVFRRRCMYAHDVSMGSEAAALLSSLG